MKIFNKILAVILCAFPIFLQGCADDSFELERNEADFQGIAVQIPYIAQGTQLSASTRAALTRAGQPTDFDSKEATINNLYVFAFSNGKNGVSDAVEVTKSELDSWTDKTTPHVVKMSLEIGEYHIYAIANVKLDDYKNMTEEEVRDYQFEAEAGLLSDFENGLPMSCSPSQITQSNNYYVKVKQNSSTEVEAKMKFAVSKVRLSMVNAIGDFTVGGVKVGKIADILNLCVDSKKEANSERTGTIDIDGLYYDLTSIKNGKYDVDNLTDGVDNPADTKSWIWQTVFYVPERLTANTTEMTLSLSNGTSKTYKLGEKVGSNYTVKRSQYYRYYVEPNSGQITLEVLAWDSESILATLGGPVNLNVDKTDLGIISGTQTAILKYNSNVNVDYESPKIDGVDVFILENGDGDDQYKSFIVKVNPELGIRSAEELKDLHYFYLTAGPLRKKIVAEPDLSPYLVVTPESYTVVMKEIANEVEYQVEYSYSTNLQTLTYAKGDGDYDNTGMDLMYYMSTSDGMSEDQVRPNSGVNLQQNGRIIVRFNEPYNPTKFQKESKIVYTYTATQQGQSTLTETVKLNIIPNLNGYRLWFRDVNDSWDNVHIYIYQPLQWNNNGTLVDVKCYKEGDNKEDAVLYSVTGKKTFKGWDTCNKAPGWNTEWNAYVFEDLRFGNNVNGGVQDRADYYHQTDFIEQWRSEIDCETCKGDNYARVWPGIQMKKVTDPNSKQYLWWYIDIPPICEPGKALIMFSKGHGTASDNKDDRYPRHLVPGIPLYDFPDREGWMKYDPEKGTDGNGNEFVDDQPDFQIVEKVYTYQMRGSIFGTDNNWYDKDMTQQSDGTWVLEAQVNAGGFGIKKMYKDSQEAWIQGENASVNTNGVNNCKYENNGGANFNLATAGTYKFVFDPEAMTLTVSGEANPMTEDGHYLAYGLGSQWDSSWPTIKMTQSGDEYYVKWTNPGQKNFCFLKKENNSITVIQSSQDNSTININQDNWTKSDGGKPWWAPDAGVYEMYYKPNNYKVWVTKN